ncbi:MAG: hypothetical protein ACK5LX_06080 [Oscillospiraceae bacterium]
MKDNDYRQAMEKIETPPELREETRQLIRREVQKSKAAPRWKPVVTAVASLAAVVALLFGMRAFFSPGDGLILTDLVAGEHLSQVELSDGSLHFQEVERGMKNPLQLSPTYPLKESWTPERMVEEYPNLSQLLQAPEGYSGPQGGATAYYGGFAEEPEAAAAKLTYAAESGEGKLELTAASDGSLVVSPLSPGNVDSSIDGEPLAVGYDEASDTYYGLAEWDGWTISFSAAGVSQEEFIRLLNGFLVNEK